MKVNLENIFNNLKDGDCLAFYRKAWYLQLIPFFTKEKGDKEAPQHCGICYEVKRENNKLTLVAINNILPDKNYYIGEQFSDYVNELKDNIILMIKLLRENNITTKNIDNMANDVIIIETIIAKIHRSIEDKRNYDKLYFKTSIDGFIDLIKTSQCNNDNIYEKEISNEYTFFK